ncbi:MAG: winged helix-turn-helix transcriptional regulator [Desulfobulbaceae bacterium]|jgi:ArsR family transcriptional regulator|nr:winged helix-turn-helix transcriptional regulator [Desulfobulbaceae bacterium]
MKLFLRVMKALSDPNRVRVLKLLENKALCVCEITEVLGLAQPTVSSHMKILEDAGLVKKVRQGTWMIYSQSDGSESEYAGTMLVTLKNWLNDDNGLQEMLKALPAAACLRVSNLKVKGTENGTD